LRARGTGKPCPGSGLRILLLPRAFAGVFFTLIKNQKN